MKGKPSPKRNIIESRAVSLHIDAAASRDFAAGMSHFLSCITKKAAES